MQYSFDHQSVNLPLLKTRAYNYRWADVPDGVIPLTAADPDFPVGNFVTDAIVDYAQSGVFSYGPPQGLPEFRQAIASWYETTKQVTLHVNNILPLNSAAFGLFVAAKTLLSPGDEAIILEPVDFLFRKSIIYAGAKVVCSQLNKTDGRIDKTQIVNLINTSTKVIYICNPNNPLGLTMQEDDLQWIGQLAMDHQLTIISDEIWADITYDHSFTAISSLSKAIADRTVIVSGLSKNFGLAGLRIGYIATTNPELFDLIYKTSQVDSTAFGLSTISQVAGAAALNHGKDWLAAFLSHLSAMKTYAQERISRYETFSQVNPNATYLLFPQVNLPKHLDSEQYCQQLGESTKVSLVPGGKQWFEQSSEGHVRICYATSEVILEEAFDRLDVSLL